MLKIERNPSYLSPSSLMQAESMPNTFYLLRLIADPIKREPQQLAAAVGSAFDYYIKMKLMEDKFQYKKVLLPDIKTGIETNINEAFIAGKIAYRAYLDSCFNIANYADVELHLDGLFNGVPIIGKLDAIVIVSGSSKAIPFDWKVTGYTAKTTMSPKPGYYRLWEGIRPKPAHKIFTDDISFEVIDKKWATQLCTYGWLMDYPIGIPFSVRVDALIWKDKKIRCIAQYRGWITEAFQQQVIIRYKNLWNSLEDGSFIKNLASSKDEDLVWITSKSETWW